jgi:hypothetical protein
LSGLAAPRATLLVALASGGLLVTAVFGLLGRAGRPRLGLAAAGTLALAALLGARAGLAQPGPAALAGALGLAASSLLVRGSGRSPAVAAGALLGAAFTVQALVALPMATLTAFVGSRPRRLLALAVGLLLAGPRLWLAFSAVSLAEVQQAAPSVIRGILPSREAAPDENYVLAMAWLRDNVGPLEPVCASPGTPARWLPALSGRRVVPPDVPWIYRDEVAPGPAVCRFAILFGPLDPAPDAFGPPSLPFAPSPGNPVFEAGDVRVVAPASAEGSVTSFDTGEGNPGPPRP